MRAHLLLLLAALVVAEDLPNIWNKIEQVGDIPTARYGHSWEIKDNEYGVLFGGFGPSADGTLVDLNDLWLFDTANRNWTLVRPAPGSAYPPARRWHTCNVIEHKRMYCYGGKSLTGTLGDMWYFDFETNLWNQVADAPPLRGRYGHTANADCASTQLIVFGGATDSELLNDMWSYNFESQSWIEITTEMRPTPRAFHSAVTSACEGIPDPFDMHIYIHGGKLKSSSGSMDVWSFHMSAAVRAQWTIETYRPDDVPLRYGHFAFDIGNVMMVWGGSVSDINTYWFNEDHNTWFSREPFASNHPAQLRFMGAELSFNKVYVFGGYDLLHDSISNDLWVYTVDPCMFQTDCDACIKRQPTCGWCSSKHACLSGGAEPTYESCPIWRTKSCVTSCQNFHSCDDCTGDINCGWCYGTPAFPRPVEGCFAGAPEGPWFGDCFDWTFDMEGCPECQATASCGDCLESPHCGYCPSSKTCMDGSRMGPLNGTCRDWVYGDKARCTAPSNCATKAGCAECTADTNCGYCQDDVPIKCMAGTSKGPLAGACKDWNYGNCTPAAECDTYRSCDKCVADKNCGFCNDLGVSRCIDGDDKGPDAGTCHNWSYGKCVAPFPTPAPAGLGAGWIVFIILISLGIAAGGFCFYWFYWRTRAKRQALSYSTLSAGTSGYGTR